MCVPHVSYFNCANILCFGNFKKLFPSQLLVLSSGEDYVATPWGRKVIFLYIFLCNCLWSISIYKTKYSNYLPHLYLPTVGYHTLSILGTQGTHGLLRCMRTIAAILLVRFVTWTAPGWLCPIQYPIQKYSSLLITIVYVFPSNWGMFISTLYFVLR